MIVDGAVLEDDERASELLAPLRALAPEMDTFARIPAAGMTAVHMDPPAPVPAVSEHTILSALDEATVDAFLAQVGPGTSTGLMFAELRQLGGALASPGPGWRRGRPRARCLRPLRGRTGADPRGSPPPAWPPASGWWTRSHPWATDRRFLNFTDRGGRAASAYDATARERLRAVRDAVDPERVFLANHEVG